MKNVLVKTSEINKVVQKKDACLVIMNDGKTWVCEKSIDDKSLVEYIDQNQSNSFIKLLLKNKDGEQ